LVAADGGKAPLDQQVGRAPRFERPANVIPKVHDLRDAKRVNVREHGFERDAVAVNISYGREFHRPANAKLGAMADALALNDGATIRRHGRGDPIAEGLMRAAYSR
jgi:hypothetical protein